MSSTRISALALCVGLGGALLAGAAMAQAQDGAAGYFGRGFPVASADLPPGRLQSRIESLPPAARRRALEWLQRFEFPAEDVDSLHVDDAGGVFYVDRLRPEPAGGEEGGGEPLPEAGLSQAETFALHSRPGAPNVIFVDFDGHVLAGTAWNSYVGTATLYAMPFDVDGDPGSFSQDELDRIAEVWHRIAEDFAPFDVDVTTEEPTSFDRYTGHVLVTEDSDEFGADMPAKGAGGVAYVGVFGSANYAYYSPALVYFDNLGGGVPTYVAEAAAHEMGHNVGLSHDGTTSGSAYYSGHGSGYVSWAPIMGVGYYQNVTQWSKGEYAGANNGQEDLAYLEADFGAVPDDHGDDRTVATALLVDGLGGVVVSNPETDPGNLYPENKGIIEHRDDVDWFFVDTGAGTLDLGATPAWDAFTRSSRRGANLDIELRLYDQSGAQLAQSDPLDDSDARIVASVTAGRYYLSVSGVGNASSPYSDYASIGMYFIAGAVPPATLDIDPPTPAVMAFASAPSATGASTIAMTAVTAADASGLVEYYFECTNAACPDSGWQEKPSYTATGLSAGTEYGFRVKARDAFGNENGWSAIAMASTPNGAPVANDDGAPTEEGSAVVIAVLVNDSDPDGHVLTVVSAGPAAHGTVTTDGSTVTYTPVAGYVGVDGFGYTISDGLATDSAVVSVTVEAAPEPPAAPGDVVAASASGEVTLTWTYVGPEVSGFQIVRETKHKKRDTWVGGTDLGTVGPGTRSFADSPGAGTFRYLVRALNAAGSSDSGWAEVTVSGGGGGGPKCNPRKEACP